MSRENVAALERHYRRWAIGDWRDAAIFDRYATGVFPDPSPRPIYGREALAEYWRQFLESWDDIRMAPTDYVVAGDSVIVPVRRTATGKGSGIEIEDHVFHVWT